MEDYESKTVEELKGIAEGMGLKLDPKAKKADIIEAIEAAMAPAETPDDAEQVPGKEYPGEVPSADESAQEDPVGTLKIVTAPIPSLNVRESPDANAKILSHLKDGDTVPYLEAVEGWYRIAGGWVMARFCQVYDKEVG